MNRISVLLRIDDKAIRMCKVCNIMINQGTIDWLPVILDVTFLTDSVMLDLLTLFTVFDENDDDDDDDMGILTIFQLHTGPVAICLLF